MFFYKTDPRAIAPTKNDTTDSGWDVYATENVIIRPGEVKKIRTGICVAFDLGFPGFAWDKSGRGSQGLKILGGVLDNFYVGEIQLIVANVNLWDIVKLLAGVDRILECGEICKSPATLLEFQSAIDGAKIDIPYGKPIAQVVFQAVHTSNQMQELEEKSFKAAFEERYNSKRGTAGFGSTYLVGKNDGT